MQVGGPFADKEGLEKSSSDGLVKEVLIWQHRALILLSPSSGSPMSISGSSKNGTCSREARRGRWDNKRMAKIRNTEVEREKKTEKKKTNNNLFIFVTDPVSMKSIELEQMMTLMLVVVDLKSIKNTRFSTQVQHAANHSPLIKNKKGLY